MTNKFKFYILNMDLIFVLPPKMANLMGKYIVSFGVSYFKTINR